MKAKAYTIEPKMFTIHNRLYVMKPSLNSSEQMTIMLISKTPEWALVATGLIIGYVNHLPALTIAIIGLLSGCIPIGVRWLFFKYYGHGRVFKTHHRDTPGTLTYSIKVPTELYATFETVRSQCARGALTTEETNHYYRLVWTHSQVGELAPMPHTVREQLWNTVLGGTRNVTPVFDMDNDETRPLYFVTGQKY